MKLNRRTLITLSLMGTAACGAIADPMPPSLQTAYGSVKKAIERLDFKAFASSFDSSFVLIDPTGKSIPKAAFLNDVKPMFQGFQSAKANTKVKSVHMLGDYAEVSFVLEIEMKGKPGTLKIREEGTDSLMLKNGKWVIYRTVQDKFIITEPK